MKKFIISGILALALFITGSAAAQNQPFPGGGGGGGGQVTPGTIGNIPTYSGTSTLGNTTLPLTSIPSKGADNAFTGNNRLGGPIPYRDFTATMPAGGCSFNDPQFFDGLLTGSITSGTNTLTASSTIFKTGCGVTIEHAGPTSTLVTPSCTPSTVVRTTNVVTVTCTANTNLVWTGTGGANGQDQGVTMSGCSDASANGTWQLASNNATTQFTFTSVGSNGTITGCSATFYLGWAHGVTGSTTYYYKIASIDSKSGMSTAVGPITISNGSASLTPSNFNAIFWPFVVNSKGTVVYRSTDNITYTCVGLQMVGIGYQDWGFTGPCPYFVPAAPPASPTAQALTTTITSGGGTTSLVLAANASNTATGQVMFHDEMPFLDACINAVNADQLNLNGYTVGSQGCYIPTGVYHFASDWSTDRITPSGGGVSIVVSGTIYGHDWPLTIGKNNYQMIGQGWSGGSSNASLGSSVQMARDTHQAAGIVIKGDAVFEGFHSQNNNGHSLMLGLSPDGLGGAAGVRIKNVLLGNSGTSAGVPLYIGGNTFQFYFDSVNFGPRSDGFPASVLMTTDSFGGIGGADIYFDQDQFLYHQFLVNAPGGYSGQGFSFSVDHMWSEEHGQYPTGGLITVDNGTGTIPGTQYASGARAAANFFNMQNADASNKTFLKVLGSGSNGAVQFYLKTVDQFNPLIACDSVSGIQSSCAQGTVTPVIISDTPQITTGTTKTYTGPLVSGTYEFGSPLIASAGNGTYNHSPAMPWFADAIPPPNNLQVTGTSSGSLASGTYCIRIVGLDAQTVPGTTLPGPEICQTVGSSSSIALAWQVPQFNGYNYSDYQLWYGSTAGNETNFISTGIAPGSSATITYNFTSTSGAASGTLPSTPTAYLSWLYRDNTKSSCLYCSAGNSIGYALGIGEPSIPSGDKLAVKGGILHAESGFRIPMSTKSADYVLTTADYWVNVTGTHTITVPHATQGNLWVVFNSGSNTVTLQPDSGTINGTASITITANNGYSVTCDLTNCFASVQTGSSSGSVTGITFNSPLTGGTINVSGSAGCPTCATATTPGAGLAHFAGGTQDMTSSKVVSADLNITPTTCTNQVVSAISSAAAGTCHTVGSSDVSLTTTTCTNQVVSAISSGGVGTCHTVASADISITTTTCTNQVVSAISSGGVGTCHTIATGDIAANAVTGAKMANNTVTATQLASQYSQWLACDGKGLGDGLNAIPAGTYLQTSCRNITGVTVTITGIKCFTDNNGSSTMNAAGNTLGALLTGAITCSNSYASGTQSANIALTSGDYIKFTFVADGTTTQTDWVITGTY